MGKIQLTDGVKKGRKVKTPKRNKKLEIGQNVDPVADRRADLSLDKAL